MQVSIILAHPTCHSFNHAIAQAAVTELQQNGHQVAFHDLYAEGFDPILPTAEISKGAAIPQQIERHCQEITSAEGILIVHQIGGDSPPPSSKDGWTE